MDNKLQKKINSSALFCWSSLMLVLVLAYVIEIIKGLRGGVYVAIVSAIGIVPLVVASLVFKNKPTSKLIRLLMILGYSLFYAIILFESPYVITVAYIFPIFGIVTAFGDAKWSNITGILNVMIVIARIAYSVLIQGKTSTIEITEYEIQFFSVFLTAIFLVIATRRIAEINQSQISKVKLNMAKTEETNAAILEAGQAVSENVADIQSSIQVQKENMDKTAKAISEMTNGIELVAENLKEQSQVTANIQEAVGNIANSAKQMTHHSDKTKELVGQNAKQLLMAKEQSEKMKEVSKEVMERLSDLEDKTNAMEGILVMISEVTDNTDLLSLNASIEAARAGEVGKGFAVVAGEIRGLADTTKKSALEIEELLRSFHELSDNVQLGVTGMLEGMEVQNRKIGDTYRGFVTMEKSLDMLDNSAHSVQNEMQQLQQSNKTIVNAISDMSATSEEIAMSAQAVEELTKETKEAGEETGEIIQVIAQQMEQLVGEDA